MIYFYFARYQIIPSQNYFPSKIHMLNFHTIQAERDLSRK